MRVLYPSLVCRFCRDCRRVFAVGLFNKLTFAKKNMRIIKWPVRHLLVGSTPRQRCSRPVFERHAARIAQPGLQCYPPPEGCRRSIYSYRGFYAATRRPGALRRPGWSPPHTPFESARTARGLRARNQSINLVGRSAPSIHALWRAERRGAREKRLRSGSVNDTRLAPPACSEPPRAI